MIWEEMKYESRLEEQKMARVKMYWMIPEQY